MQGATWKISYGDQSSASGIVGTDTVNVGGLVIQNQAVELATQLSDEFQRDTGSGLLGLAFGTLNTVQPTPVKTPVENMIAQNDIKGDMQLFTAKLGSWRDANEPDKGESFYTFGFIDQATVVSIHISLRCMSLFHITFSLAISTSLLCPAFHAMLLRQTVVRRRY